MFIGTAYISNFKKFIEKLKKIKNWDFEIFAKKSDPQQLKDRRNKKIYREKPMFFSMELEKLISTILKLLKRHCNDLATDCKIN